MVLEIMLRELLDKLKFKYNMCGLSLSDLAVDFLASLAHILYCQ